MDTVSNPTTLEDATRVAQRCGASKSQIYKLLAAGRFPEPAARAPRFTRWRSSDVDAWISDPAAWLNKGAKAGAERDSQ